MRRSLRRTFFRPERPTLTSRSLQSITRPFQKRFREVFGNARILIFYLSIKAWKEKSLPKSHLGWFFLCLVKVKRQKKINYVNFLVHLTFNYFVYRKLSSWDPFFKWYHNRAKWNIFTVLAPAANTTNIDYEQSLNLLLLAVYDKQWPVSCEYARPFILQGCH